jgi:hypothetical protein
MLGDSRLQIADCGRSRQGHDAINDGIDKFEIKNLKL